MNKFEVWKRKKDKREKTIPNDQALRMLCDNIKETYPERYTHQTNEVTPYDELKGYSKVTWDKNATTSI